MIPTPSLPVPLRVGEILDRSFRLMPKLFPSLIVLWALSGVIATIQQWAMDNGEYLTFIPIILVNSIFGLFVHACAIFLASDGWLGLPISLDSAWKRATISKIFRAFLLGIFISVVGLFFLLLFIIPGLVYYMNRCLAGFFIFLEDEPIDRAIERSKFLMTQGRWYSLSGPWMRMTGLYLITIIIMIVIGFLTGVGVAGTKAASPLGVASLVVTFVATMVTQALASFTLIVITGFFYDLRARYEGTDLLSALANQAPSV